MKDKKQNLQDVDCILSINERNKWVAQIRTRI